MWFIFENRFQHILPMNISTIFTDGSIKKLAEFENIIDHTNNYQATYDKVASLVREKSYINIK